MKYGAGWGSDIAIGPRSTVDYRRSIGSSSARCLVSYFEFGWWTPKKTTNRKIMLLFPQILLRKLVRKNLAEDSLTNGFEFGKSKV